MNPILLITRILIALIFSCVSLKSQTYNKNELSKQFFEAFTQKINDSIPALGSIIISQNNNLIYEQYFHGANENTIFNIKSATKSIVSVLAGIAKDKNLLPDINTPVLKILTEYNMPRDQFQNVWYQERKHLNDSIRNTVTLKNLLTMQGGFAWAENGVLTQAMANATDPVRFTLDLPFEEYPGTTFNYNTGEIIIFGAALAKIIQSDLKDFADENLFKPLNMTIQIWKTDPLNRNIGGSEMYMKPNEMLKFGLLILNDGKFKNKQIVSSQWLRESTSEQVKLDFWDVLPNANGYGYYWWRRKTNNHQAFIASGYGGQLICIIPDLKMVIMSACFLNSTNRGRVEIQKLHNFIDEVTKRAGS